MKNALPYSLLGLLAFLLFLLLLAPANLITEQLAKWLSDFHIHTVEGTATGGSVQGVSWRGVRIDRLEWDWRPLALLAGWLEFHVNIDDPEMKLAGMVAINVDQHMRFRNLTGRLLFTQLTVLTGQPKLPLQGVIEFDLPDLHLSSARQPLSVSGMIHMIDSRLTLGQLLTLGDFTAEMSSADPEGIQGIIKDNNGPLMLEGTFSLLPDGRYRFSGQTAVRDANNRALRQAMNLLGPSNGDGRWILSLSGVLSR